MHPHRLREWHVRGEQFRVHRLRKRRICGIVCREVMPEIEDPPKERFVFVARDGQVAIVAERLTRAILAHAAGRDTPAQRGRNLDAAERRRVQDEIGCLDRRSDPLVVRRAEKVLDQRGCIRDDDSQEAFLR